MSGGADKQARVKCQKKKKKTFNISQKFDCKSYTGGGGVCQESDRGVVDSKRKVQVKGAASLLLSVSKFRFRTCPHFEKCTTLTFF